MPHRDPPWDPNKMARRFPRTVWSSPATTPGRSGKSTPYYSFGVTVLSAGELGLPEPEETGDTFTANALLIEAAMRKLPALSDISGLAVDALGAHPVSIRRAGVVQKRTSTQPCTSSRTS